MKRFLISALTLILISLPAAAASKLEFSFFFGPSLAQFGAIEKLGDPDVNLGGEFNYFIKDQHGIGFSYSNEFDFNGSSSFPGIKEGSISTFDLHYAYRHFFSPKFHLVFEPGIGWQTLYDESGDYYWGYTSYDDLATSFILNYKLMGRWIVSEFGAEGAESNFFLGAGLMQIYSLSDELNGKDISGNRLSLLIQLGLGF